MIDFVQMLSLIHVFRYTIVYIYKSTDQGNIATGLKI